MASGVLCVTRSGPVALGLEAYAHQRVERVVLDRHPMRLSHPWPERFIRGKAFGPAEGALQTGEDRGRE
jgi:hypothetical protein